MAAISSHLTTDSVSITPSVRSAERTWPLTAVLVASGCIVVGLIWDISWHRSIGRDSFWSAPHILEQVGALVAACTCGWLVLQTTFGGDSASRATSVYVWGFRGPLGAWVCIWGAVMMVTSAPFDNWWHNAYGLDVKILSPPHAVLAIGMIAIQVGALLMALAKQNRANAETQQQLSLMYAAASGIILALHATVLLENAAFPNHMHSVAFYVMTAVGMPLILLATSRPSHLRWPATTTAAIYMGIALVMIWILPLFPATARLAPIYNPVTHMVPPPFPLLIVVPAIAIDIIMRRVRNDWWRAALIGASFVVLMLVVHWWWGEFLLSPAARNAFFAGDQWDYNVRPGPWQQQFWNTEQSAAPFVKGLLFAIVTAMATSRLGLWIGAGMARVQR
ncbi:MAG: hypothetical protein ABJB74_23185 [Gemmatimonas sp.]